MRRLVQLEQRVPPLARLLHQQRVEARRLEAALRLRARPPRVRLARQLGKLRARGFAALLLRRAYGRAEPRLRLLARHRLARRVKRLEPLNLFLTAAKPRL